MKVDGGCHCGNITFAADIDPENITVCHCTDCQALSGTAFRVVVRVPREKIEWRGGKPKVYVKTAESGTRRAQAFCPECGTPVYSGEEGEPKHYGLRLGTIRQRAQLKPAKQIWCRSSFGWLADLRSMPRAEKQP
jgi:hypothetical protein